MVDTPRKNITTTTIAPNTGQDVNVINASIPVSGAGAGTGGLQNLETKAEGNRTATTSATDLSVSGSGLATGTTYIIITNQGSVEVRVRVDTDPTTSIGYDLQPNEVYERPIKDDAVIKGITASSTAVCYVEEYGPA